MLNGKVTEINKMFMLPINLPASPDMFCIETHVTDLKYFQTLSDITYAYVRARQLMEEAYCELSKHVNFR